MHVAKITVKGKVRFVEVRKVADKVAFDPRPGWVLTAFPLSDVAYHRDVVWFHPDDTLFDWVRDFSFGD